ncbi:hypothetical protein IQ251_19015 [Saccharopolyspora sp. HNM0983]|uniref:Uncharacterized protein n=1 Tax=Saccharopolyspora montiporae TaxID=2781240 RepID=A0A929BCY8_9PSEU|nr:hypothetical protein [Saccharopolyspora sp. HNM0983]MBE9376546.1 hypothetical protein [Saccharopolyspora sp. HNM0983]
MLLRGRPAARTGRRGRADRHELLHRNREVGTAQPGRLTRAGDALDHLLECPRDDPLTCPATGAHLTDRVDRVLRALSGDA